MLDWWSFFYKMGLHASTVELRDEGFVNSRPAVKRRMISPGSGCSGIECKNRISGLFFKSHLNFQPVLCVSVLSFLFLALIFPMSAQANWAHEAMHIQEAIESVGQGSPVTVAVISTGVDTDHPDLQGKLLPPVNLTQDTSASHDPLGQGTFLVAIRSAKKVGEKR